MDQQLGGGTGGSNGKREGRGSKGGDKAGTAKTKRHLEGNTENKRSRSFLRYIHI